MNINIICIGKIKDKYINDGIAEFSKRMTSFVTLNIIELKEYNREDSINISIEKESSEILKQISKSNSYNVLLDLDGKEINSENMSKYIDDLKNKGISSINFIIGGSNGVNKEVH